MGHGAKVHGDLAISVLGVILCGWWWGLLGRLLSLWRTVALLSSTSGLLIQRDLFDGLCQLFYLILVTHLETMQGPLGFSCHF